MFRLWCFFLNSFGCLPFVPSFVYSLWQFEGNWRQVFHWRNKSMCLVILYGELYRTTIWMRSFYGQLPVPQPTNQPTNQISRSSDQELRRFGFGENFTATLSWILRGWNSSKDTVDLIKKGGACRNALDCSLCEYLLRFFVGVCRRSWNSFGHYDHPSLKKCWDFKTQKQPVV